MVRLFAVLLPVLALASGTAACAAPVGDIVTPAELRERIAVLASDDFGGRRPGTPGAAKTEAYIIESFTAAGLAPGAADGGWRQPVALVERVPRSVALTFRHAGRSVTVGGEGAIFLGAQAATRITAAPVWFVGAGEPALLDKVDLRGAVVLTIQGRGQAGEARAALARRGAAAVLVVVPATVDWTKVTAQVGGGTAAAAGDPPGIPSGYIASAAATRALAIAGGPPNTRLLAGSPPVRLELTADVAAETAIGRFAPANIIGKVAGSDPTAGAVVLTAHWDHLGLCRPAGAADRICNGANDNGSGVAMLIETARRLAAGPRPVRDVYFVATTAEEMGELGAAAFVAAPPVPIGRFVAGLNLDTAAIGPAGLPVAIIGRGRTPALDRVIDATARRLGRPVDTDNEADVMMERQDGWKLAQAGVPAVMVSGSFSDMRRLMAYLGGVYHRPDDDMAHLGDLSGAAEDATLNVALARALADPAIYPRAEK